MRELILDYVDDLVSNFLYYDRKEDEELQLGAIETAVINREITLKEMVEQFRRGLVNSLPIVGE